MILALTVIALVLFVAGIYIGFKQGFSVGRMEGFEEGLLGRRG